MADEKNIKAEEAKAEKPAKAKADTTASNLVPLSIPLEASPNASKQEFFSVNGKNYIIQKGKTVMVPPEVKEVYDNNQRQIASTVDYAEAQALREAQ